MHAKVFSHVTNVPVAIRIKSSLFAPYHVTNDNIKL